MKRHHRILAAVVAGVLLLISGSLAAYYLSGSMSPVQSYERGLPSLPQHVLIATQGSAFKDRLVNTLVAQLQQRPAYVKVVDVAGLGGVDERAWQAIVIVHSWQLGHPPQAVTEFVARLENPAKVIDVTTSANGREKLPGVDVISSASVLDEVPELVARIILKVDAAAIARH